MLMKKAVSADEINRLPAQVRTTILDASAKDDPVGRQYLYDSREENILPVEDSDPIGDHAHMPVPGLVHRYPDRVLLKITDTCAVYCRFCFRKDMVGQGAGILDDEDIEKSLAYVRARPEIREIILTGGDPFTLSNRRLAALMDALSAIPHLDIIRIHTRAPLVQPGRIDASLCALLNKTDKAIYIVLHVNHAREINESVISAVRLLATSGAVLLSQSVLLKGVNDNPETLESLFRTLLRHKIKPYYLHHPDLAPGTGHFRLSIQEGQTIVRALRGRISGLAWPTYVLDIPGGYGKMPLGPAYIEHLADGACLVEDYKGEKHLYPPHADKGKDQGA